MSSLEHLDTAAGRMWTEILNVFGYLCIGVVGHREIESSVLSDHSYGFGISSRTGVQRSRSCLLEHLDQTHLRNFSLSWKIYRFCGFGSHYPGRFPVLLRVQLLLVI